MVVKVHPRVELINCPNQGQGAIEEPQVHLLSVDKLSPNQAPAVDQSAYQRDLSNEDWPLKYTKRDTIDQEPFQAIKTELTDQKSESKTAIYNQQQRVTIDKLNSAMIDRHNIHRVFGHKIWFVADVCGIICASFTYWLLLFAQYVVLTCILLPEQSYFYKGNNNLLIVVTIKLLW